jgi:ComF family protein
MTWFVAGRTLAHGLIQILYPNLCWHCRQPIAAPGSGFCEACAKAIFSDPFSSCGGCAATVGPHSATEKECPTCRDQGFAFKAAFRLGPYDGGLREIILRLKDGSREGLAELVAAQWVAGATATLANEPIDCVVPVPLHWLRRWRRGYNQSATLAKAWAARLRVPFLPRALRRIKNTKQQSGLSPAARRANIHGVFRAAKSIPLAAKTVLLIDDVMTTGSTAHEAARTLRAAGARRVVLGILARA